MAWYQLAANQNNSFAQNSIGVLYDNGFGVPQDYYIAMNYYLKAAGNNDNVAKENIG
jgi:TPR repeat protein